MGYLVGCSGPAAAPRLIADDTVAADLRALADETWGRFLAIFQARTGCFSDVHLRATYDLDKRATYDPVTATVTVKVPATAAMLQGALVHEWAHHIEYQCEAHKTLRPAFLATQGLPVDLPWWGISPADPPAVKPSADGWADIPSEQYAEATIELVLGGRAISTSAWVSPQAVQMLARWAAGE